MHSVSSISRKNCYIVSAGDLQNRYSTHEESGKRMTPGLLIGCHVDTSTGLVTFTVNGQEAANKFQVRAQCAVKGVSRMDFFIGECKTEGSKTESGGGVPGKGKQPPPHQLGGLGLIFHWGCKTEGPKTESGFLGRGSNCWSAVSFPGGVRDGAPTTQRFSTIFSTQDVLSSVS